MNNIIKKAVIFVVIFILVLPLFAEIKDCPKNRWKELQGGKIKYLGLADAYYFNYEKKEWGKDIKKMEGEIGKEIYLGEFRYRVKYAYGEKLGLE